MAVSSRPQSKPPGRPPKIDVGRLIEKGGSATASGAAEADEGDPSDEIRVQLRPQRWLIKAMDRCRKAEARNNLSTKAVSRHTWMIDTLVARVDQVAESLGIVFKADEVRPRSELDD